MTWLTTDTILFATALFIFMSGAAGVVLRRNPIAMLMAVELMLNAAILTFVLASRVKGQPVGHSAALIVLVLGAAEAVVGLSLALAVFRNRDFVDVDEPQELVG